MRKLSFFALLLILASCGTETPSGDFCECIDVSNELMEHSQNLLYDERENEDVDKLAELRAKKEEACKPFEQMGGEEMLKLIEECNE